MGKAPIRKFRAKRLTNNSVIIGKTLFTYDGESYGITDKSRAKLLLYDSAMGSASIPQVRHPFLAYTQGDKIINETLEWQCSSCETWNRNKNNICGCGVKL